MMSVGSNPALLCEQAVRALADLDLALDRIGLAPLVEGHHDDRRAVAADEPRLVQEVGFAFLQRDGVHDRLALHALQARLDDGPLRAVDHHRHARDLRLCRDVAQERGHRLLGVEHGFVHVDVDQVRATAHLLERDGRGFPEVVVFDQPRKPFRAGDVGPLADHLEVAVRTNDERFEAGETREDIGRRFLSRWLRETTPDVLSPWARRNVLDRRRERRDVIRRRATAAAEDVGEAARRELAEQPRRLGRQLVVLAERVRQSGVGIAGHPAVRQARQLFEVRPHLPGAERTVQADAPWPRVVDRQIKRFERLARERPPAPVGDRHRDHERQRLAGRLADLVDRDERGLRVQRVEDRLDEQDVGAAVDEPADLLGVRVLQLIEGDRAYRRVVDVRRDRQRPVGRPDRAGHEPGLLRRARRVLVGRGPGEPRGGDVDLVHERLQAVVALGDGVRVERVGLDDVGARLEVLAVNAADHVRPRQHEHVAVALEVVRMPGELLAAEVRLLELVALDHRAHRAVQDQEALRQGAIESFDSGHRYRSCSCAWGLTRTLQSPHGLATLRPSAVILSLGPRRYQHRERIARPPRADADGDV